MGFNTSVVVLNDCLTDIEKDPHFGKKLASAVTSISTQKFLADEAGKPFSGVSVSAGCCGNAATVIETHHADETQVLAFHGNIARQITPGVWPTNEEWGTPEYDVAVLKALADRLGYHIRKKPQRKG